MKAATIQAILFDVAKKAKLIEHHKHNGIPIDRRPIIDDTARILRLAGHSVTDDAIETILFHGRT